MPNDTPSKKVGIAVMFGRSNTGKSTLLNSLIGTKVAITTPKPQTTRDTIQGVVHDPRGQVVFVDTPGIFKKIPDLLTKKLNEQAKDSLNGVDIILHVVDPTRHVGEEEALVRRLIARLKTPKLLIVNKSDVDQPYIDEYLAWRDDYDDVIEVSALNASNMTGLLDAVFALLPEGVPLYPDDQFTDKDMKFRLAELIREKIFLALHQEVPYSTTVEVHEVDRRENGTLYIGATILTTSTRYKKMLIGAGGKTVKAIGKSVRKELEIVTGEHIFLDLDVAVDPRWQERMH